MINQAHTSSLKKNWISFIHDLQDQICRGLEVADGKSGFGEDNWERPGGGGGKTKVITNGDVFEKGGVATSNVYGEVDDNMREQLNIEGKKWFACGISIVIHPLNPYVPTVHANWRYFELYDAENLVIDRWFGGGADLTPNYIFEEDASHFHQTFKHVMDLSEPEWYPRFKRQCDEYFINKHRNNEMRGIGGVFYDYLRPVDEVDAERLFEFQRICGNSFLEAYLPIVARRKKLVYGDREKEWQEIRRGRYVEFNLLYDRGTIFGLKTKGRTESILMSLPPRARWNYQYEPVQGSEEDKLRQVCLHPREWITAGQI